MKKYLSLKSVCGVAVVVLMTSCVAKKKYTEAQNTITQLQTENAQLKETGTSMQQNIVTLESSNRNLQTSLDSTNTWVTGQQSRWNSFQAFYDEGTKTTEQVHQMLHTQLDDLIGAENITTNAGRIYVTLAEKTLFASGSSRLSIKGTQVLEQLAQAIKDNPNVEIDIAATPGFYTASNMSTGSMDNSMSSSTTTTQSNTTTTTSDPTIKQDDDLKYKDQNTKVKVDHDGDIKIKQKNNANMSSSTVKRSATSSYTAKKSSTTRSTARKSSESKSRMYASSPSRKTSVSSSSTWSLNMARSGAIAKKLVDEGVAKSRILVNSDNAASTGTKDFQVIISPKADTYYNTIGNGNTTSGGMNK